MAAQHVSIPPHNIVSEYPARSELLYKASVFFTIELWQQLPNQPNQFLGRNSSPGHSSRIALYQHNRVTPTLEQNFKPSFHTTYCADLNLVIKLRRFSCDLVTPCEMVGEVPASVAVCLPVGLILPSWGWLVGAQGNNLDLTTNSRQSWLCYTAQYILVPRSVQMEQCDCHGHEAQPDHTRERREERGALVAAQAAALRVGHRTVTCHHRKQILPTFSLIASSWLKLWKYKLVECFLKKLNSSAETGVL